MNKNNTILLYWFLMFWGACFALIPFVLLLAAGTESNFWIDLVLICAGLTVFGTGLVGVIKAIYSVRILKKGQKSVGHFVSFKSVGSVNHKEYYKITFCFEGENNVVFEYTSGQTFTYEECERYKRSKGFDVRYLGHRAAIDIYGRIYEDLEETRKHVDPGCEYCGSVYEGEKCPHCGATRKVD